MDFKTGFTIWHGLGINYEFGKLEAPARIAIHYSHRIGAIVLSVMLLVLMFLMHKNSKKVKELGNWNKIIGLLLVVQIGLGIANVTKGLPLAVATAHNGVAALLLMSLVSIVFLVFKK